MSNRVLYPPDIKPVQREVIFLAGPIQGAPNWQLEAIDLIHNQTSKLTIANPRKDYAPGEFIYNAQVDWETYHLQRAARLGGIAFWLAVQTEPIPDRAYGQTSRFELGEWIAKKQYFRHLNIAVGIEEGFGNDRYLKRRIEQDCPEVPILTNLEDTCQAIIDLVINK